MTPKNVTDTSLVLGDGFLAQAFKRAGYNTSSIREIKDPSFISGYRTAEVVINCVAFTDTRKAKDYKNWKELFNINSIFPCSLFDRLKEDGKKLIHISTGCLYGHEHYLPTEDLRASPIDTYSHSKLIADEYLKDKGVLILRPRLLYGTFPHPKNLFDRLLKFNTFFDVLNSVTSVEHIVSVIPVLMGETGIFNIDSDVISMHGVAGIMGLNPERNNSPIKGFPNIVMSTAKLWSKTGFPLYNWEFSILNSWTSYKKSVIE